MSEKEETKKIHRGIRNNNPLNIRKGSHWIGERPVQTDRAFEEYESMEYGIRAGFYLLRKYMSGYSGLTQKFNTIALIIKRWAPPSENATQRYIDSVSKETGIPANQKLSFTNKKVMCDIVAAMIRVECGCTVERSVIESGYDLL